MTKTYKLNQYSSYSIEDFDKYDCLYLSKRFYLVLVFVLRGYIVWLMSVTNMNDRVVTMQWIYPDTRMFFLSLISGSLGLLVTLVISLRRPNSVSWIKKLWPHCRTLLVFALLFDFTVNLVAYFYWQFTSLTWVISQGGISTILIILCFSSKRMKINLLEFPEKLPEN